MLLPVIRASHCTLAGFTRLLRHFCRRKPTMPKRAGLNRLNFGYLIDKAHQCLEQYGTFSPTEKSS